MIVKLKTVPLPKEIHIILVIWGEKYCRNFLQKNLSFRLSENNLPALAKNFCVKYKIHTPKDHFHFFQSSSEFKDLSTIVETQLIAFTPLPLSCRYNIFSKIHMKAVEESYLNDAALIFDIPDAVYVNNVFSDLVKLIKAGKRLMLAPGVSLTLEDFYVDPIFINNLCKNNQFSNADLLKVALRNLHPHRSKLRFKHEPKVLDNATHLYWKLNDHNFFHQSFHCHSLYIWPEQYAPMICQTVDQGDWLFKACPTKKNHYLATGDELTYFELTGINDKYNEPRAKPSPLLFVMWGKSYAHLYQQSYFKKRKYYFSSPGKNIWLTHIHWFFFILSYSFLNAISLKLLKPFFYKIYKANNNRSDLSFLYFLRKIRIWNLQETVFSNALYNYKFEDSLNFFLLNKSHIRLEIFDDFCWWNSLEISDRNQLLKIIIQEKPTRFLKEKMTRILMQEKQYQLIEEFCKFGLLKGTKLQFLIELTSNTIFNNKNDALRTTLLRYILQENSNRRLRSKILEYLIEINDEIGIQNLNLLPSLNSTSKRKLLKLVAQSLEFKSTNCFKIIFHKIFNF